MKRRFNIALALAVVLSMIMVTGVFADLVTSDVDEIVAGNQVYIDLGDVAPGSIISTSTSFQLVCSGTKHADIGDLITIYKNSSTIPGGGALTAGNATIGTIPESWPDDTSGGGSTNCPSGITPIADNGNSSVIITAPSTSGDYDFVVQYKVQTSGGISSTDVVANIPDVTFHLSVIANTAPKISVTGVNDGYAYEFGSVPSAGCSVTDTEDGNQTFAATINPITGSLSSNGLGSQTASCSYTDNGGLNAYAEATYTIVDTTKPTIVAATTTIPNAAGWYKGNVTVHFTCFDTVGIPLGACPADQILTSEGSAVSSIAQTVTDLAGNTSLPSNVITVKIDKTAPNANAEPLPAANANGWNNTSVTVSFSGDDALSGIASCDLPVVLSTEGEDQSASGTCTDKAGNVSEEATASGINIDLTAPHATAKASPLANANGWNNTSVTVSFSGTDALSGIASCDSPVVLGTEGEDQSASGACTDKAGNISEDATASGINIDLTAPTITWIGGPVDGSSFYFGFGPGAPTCSATDALSGSADDCTVSDYDATVGPHTIKATAHDLAGNETEESRTYTVLAWTLKGFYQPVDMPDTWNSVKNGSTVPFKFEIFAGTQELNSLSYVKSFTATPIVCPISSFLADPIEFTTTGATSLRYDTAAGQFINNWQTPKKAGSCYSVTMTTIDGTNQSAWFRLK